MCFPESDRSFPAPLAMLHPRSEVIKTKAAKLNKVNFFTSFSFCFIFCEKARLKFVAIKPLSGH